MSIPSCGPPPTPLSVGLAASLARSARAAIDGAAPVAWVSGSARTFGSVRERDLAAAEAACAGVDGAVDALGRYQAARLTAYLAYQGAGS